MNFWLFAFYFVTIAASPLFKFKGSQSSSKNIYQLVSSKTNYDFVYGKIKRPNSNCKPVKIWMLMRHGTRYPAEDEIPLLLAVQLFQNQILKNHEERRGSLSFDELEQLKNWRVNSNVKNKEFSRSLTMNGKNTIYKIGERVKNAFPELIINNPNDSDLNSYVFRASNTARTNETLLSFTEGLFSKRGLITPITTPESEKVVEVYRTCHNWHNDYQSQNYDYERYRFTLSTEFMKMVTNISNRLGFVNPLNFREIFGAYSTCRYELAWSPEEDSIWCKLFLEKEMKTMEFMEDLSYYYVSGPGRTLSVKLGCFAVSDMFHHFKQAENQSLTDQPKGVFYFGHTLSIQLLLAALKINEQQKPLKATNHHSSENRQFRTSFQTPFTANLIAVLYKCEGTSKPYKVMFYLCEKPLNVHYCKGDLCDWEDLKKKFQKDIDTCSLDICDKKD